MSITFTDSTGNLVLDYEPSEILESYEDEEFGLVYLGVINETVYFEGTSNQGIVRGKATDATGLSDTFECSVNLSPPPTTTTSIPL